MVYLPAWLVDPARVAFDVSEEGGHGNVLFSKALKLLAKHYTDPWVRTLTPADRFYLCWRHVECRTHPDLAYVGDRLVTISNNVATMVPIFLLGFGWELGTAVLNTTGDAAGHALFAVFLLGCAVLSFLRFRTVRRNIAVEVAGVLIVTETIPQAPAVTGTESRPRRTL